MDAIINVFQFIQGLGVSVVMPIVIFIIGCAFRTGVGKSLRAGLTVGVGFYWIEFSHQFVVRNKSVASCSSDG